jgi:hypothetical protein
MIVLCADNREAAMTLSVWLDPILEAKVEEEAKRLGLSKSELVTDALTQESL